MLLEFLDHKVPLGRRETKERSEELGTKGTKDREELSVQMDRQVLLDEQVYQVHQGDRDSKEQMVHQVPQE